jgi:hypothetical protein
MPGIANTCICKFATEPAYTNNTDKNQINLAVRQIGMIRDWCALLFTFIPNGSGERVHAEDIKNRFDAPFVCR